MKNFISSVYGLGGVFIAFNTFKSDISSAPFAIVLCAILFALAMKVQKADWIR